MAGSKIEYATVLNHYGIDKENRKSLKDTTVVVNKFGFKKYFAMENNPKEKCYYADIIYSNNFEDYSSEHFSNKYWEYFNDNPNIYTSDVPDELDPKLDTCAGIRDFYLSYNIGDNGDNIKRVFNNYKIDNLKCVTHNPDDNMSFFDHMLDPTEIKHADYKIFQKPVSYNLFAQDFKPAQMILTRFELCGKDVRILELCDRDRITPRSIEEETLKATNMFTILMNVAHTYEMYTVYNKELDIPILFIHDINDDIWFDTLSIVCKWYK